MSAASLGGVVNAACVECSEEGVSGEVSPNGEIGGRGFCSRGEPLPPAPEVIDQESLAGDENIEQHLLLTSGNVGSAELHQALFARPLGIQAAQKTHMDLSAQGRFSRNALRKGWNVAFGKPLAKKHQKGGVMVMASHPAQPVVCRAESADELYLQDTYRWVSAATPVGSGRHTIVVDSFWGNASEDAEAEEEDEAVLEDR